MDEHTVIGQGRCHHGNDQFTCEKCKANFLRGAEQLKNIAKKPPKPHKNGSKKWLHGSCAAKSILIENTETSEPEQVTTKEKVSELTVNRTLKEHLIEMLGDNPLINPEFARGAAWMYLQMENNN